MAKQAGLTYTVEEAAELIGISRAKAYDCVRSGELRSVQLGRRIVIPRVALEKLLGLTAAEFDKNLHEERVEERRTKTISSSESQEERVNTIHVIGRLTRDPELRTTKAGRELCSFRVAVPRRRSGIEANGAVFINVVAFGAEAIAAAMHLSKGSQVAVAGRLEQREWTANDGSSRSRHEIVAREIQFTEPLTMRARSRRSRACAVTTAEAIA